MRKKLLNRIQTRNERQVEDTKISTIHWQNFRGVLSCFACSSNVNKTIIFVNAHTNE